jgi:hypothetical protein
MDTLIGASQLMWRFACAKVVRTTLRDLASKDTPDLNPVIIRGKALTHLTARPVRTRMLQAELLNRENRGCCSFFFWLGPRDPNFFRGSENLGVVFGGHFSSPISPLVGRFSRSDTPLDCKSQPTSSKIPHQAPRSRRNSLDIGRDLGVQNGPPESENLLVLNLNRQKLQHPLFSTM